MSDIFDWDGANHEYGSWGQKQHTRTFKNGTQLFILFDNTNKVDNVQPYYPASSRINGDQGKGWDVNEDKAPTSYKIGRSNIKQDYPYSMVIYGQGASNRRLAILSFKDLQQFKAVKNFVRRIAPPLKILRW